AALSNVSYREAFLRLLTYTTRGNDGARIGARLGERVLDLRRAAEIARADLPATMKELLRRGPPGLETARMLVRSAEADARKFAAAFQAARELRYLPPVPDADQFLCVGKNYRAHLEELKKHDLIKEMPEEVTGFVKIHACLTGHREKVAKPAPVEHLD